MTFKSTELTRGIARPLISASSNSTSLPRVSFKLAILVGAVLLLAVFSQPSVGAQINYGTHMGTHVSYVNVTEDSGADEPLPLFGAPTVTGNSIDFNPVGFDAASANGGSDITNSNLVFMVVAKSGSRIDSITLTEMGDTTLAGNVAPGSMGTASAVFASGTLDIHEVNFVGINHISVPFSLSFSPSGGTYFLGTDGGGGPSYSTPWSGSVTLDIEAILLANGFVIPPGPVDPDGGATKISIDLDNTLVAVSQQGTSALINKTDFGGVTVRVNVPTEPGGDVEIPEPTCFMLAGLGLLGIVLNRRAR